MRNRIPIEISASILAASTVLIALLPLNLPPWAIFIGWAGTFAAGGPTKEVLQKIYPTMLVGSITGLIVAFTNQWIALNLSGGWAISIEMIALFVLNASAIAMTRFDKLAFIPGIFFGFISYVAILYGGWGPVEGNLWSAFLAVIIVNLLGPLYAWLNERLSFPIEAETTEKSKD